MPHPARLLTLTLLMPLLWLAACANAADCDRGRALYEQVQAQTEPQARIALLKQSTDLCPDPVAFGTLAEAYMATGALDPALTALKSADQASGDRDQQVQIQALMARIYLAQGRLPEAIAAIGLAYDLGRGQVPDWVHDQRRAIDTHPGRARLSAAEINRGLTLRGLGAKGFTPVPRVDLYIHFDYDKDQPNAEGRTQAEALAEALAIRGSDPAEQYRLIGHTDIQGKPSYNQGLSERRAASVRRLIDARHPALAQRLTTEGRGESEPKEPGTAEADHAQNRRVEVQVTRKPQ